MQLSNMVKFPMAWTSAEGPESGIVLSTRVRLARNLSGFAFPEKASGQELKKIMETALDAVKKTKSLSKAAIIRLEDTDPVDRRFLIERHQISHQLAAEAKNRAVAIGTGEELSSMINEEDHLRLQGISSGFSVHETVDKVDALDEELGRRLRFAYDDRFGFLTACPTNVGTGLRVSCLVHLPALTRSGQMPKVLENLSKLGMTARGLYGEGTNVQGDFYQISNATCLGRTEHEFAENLVRLVKSLLARETETRQSLLQGALKIKTEDAIYRSLGIIEKARAISYEEALQCFSFVRMGLLIGLEMPLTFEKLNELMILIQPAHIQMLEKRELRPDERDAERANFLREKLV